MRNVLNKIVNVMKVVFGWGVMLSLFAGGLTFFGYLAALIIGGDTATMICEIIYKKIIPVVIYTSTVMVLLGMLARHLDFSNEAWYEAIGACVPRKTLDVNIKAFDMGRMVIDQPLG